MKKLSAINLVAMAMVASVLSLYLFAPRFYVWNVFGEAPYCYYGESSRALELHAQLFNPSFTAINPANKVIEWRLLLPVIGHALHLPYQIYFALPMIFSVVLVGAAAFWVGGKTGSHAAAFCAAALTATSSVFFISTGFLGYADSLLLLFMVGAIVAKNPLSLWILASLAPWVDERFILALPIVFWCRLALGGKLLPVVWLLVGLLPYLGLRLYAWSLGETHTVGYLQTVLAFDHNPERLTLGLWDSLRWGWILALAGVLASPIKTQLVGWLLLPVTLAVHLLIAGDYSRSLAVALPLVLTGIILIWKLPKAGGLIALLVLANLGTPAYHSFRAFHYPIKTLPEQLYIFNGK